MREQESTRDFFIFTELTNSSGKYIVLYTKARDLAWEQRQIDVKYRKLDGFHSHFGDDFDMENHERRAPFSFLFFVF